MADRQTKVEAVINVIADMFSAREDFDEAISQMVEFGKIFSIDNDIINEAIGEIAERMGHIDPM
jgi:hypothetical protein